MGYQLAARWENSKDNLMVAVMVVALVHQLVHKKAVQMAEKWAELKDFW